MYCRRLTLPSRHWRSGANGCSTCTMALPAMSLPPELPSHIGKYEVKRLLGKGATGSVYLAVDPFGQREVALKVLEKLPTDPDAARRQLRFFQNEAALAGK